MQLSCRPAVAEGDAYGNDSGGGNSTFYSLQAVISAGAAGFFGLAPNAVRCGDDHEQQ